MLGLHVDMQAKIEFQPPISPRTHHRIRYSKTQNVHTNGIHAVRDANWLEHKHAMEYR